MTPKFQSLPILKYRSVAIFGLLFNHMYNYLTQRTAIAGEVSFSVSLYLYSALSLFLVVVVLAQIFLKKDITRSISAYIVFLALGVLGAFLLGVRFEAFSINVQATLGALCIGVANGWLYLLWGSWYKKLSVKEATSGIFLTMAFGSVGKLLVMYVPSVYADPFLMVLPILCFLCFCFVSRIEVIEETPSFQFDKERIYELRWMGLGIAVFGFTLGVVQRIRFGEFMLADPLGLLMIHGGEVVVAALIIYLALVKKTEPSYTQIWRVTLFMMASGLVGFALLPESLVVYAMVLIAIAQTTLVMILYWVLSDIAHRTSFHHNVIFGLGWLAYAVAIPIGTGFALIFFHSTAISNLVIVCVYAVLIAIVFLIKDTDPTQAELLGDLKLKVQADNKDQLSVRIREITDEYSLTPREVDVIQLLAIGRTRSYIANTLVISENTVKGHVKRIYSKLGIANKQELLDIIDL